jgi:hypothetical protein
MRVPHAGPYNGSTMNPSEEPLVRTTVNASEEAL